jgi:hypothetical protein
MRGASARLVVLVACSCGAPAKPAPAAPEAKPIRLAVMPAESDTFPNVAQAVSQSLAAAHVANITDTKVEKVSLEVVQLQIECIDPTAACYAAVGKSLSANKLLFAQVEPADKKQLKVTVTLFDVDASAPAKTAEKVFASEADANAGIAGLVTEATQP